MAKITPSALINEIRGTLAGSTFRTNRSGIHVYPKQRPRNPRSVDQSFSRASVNYVSGSWSTLTDTQKSLWNRFASRSGKFISGFNAFSSLNCNLMNSNYSGLACVTNPPTTVERPPLMQGLFANEAGGTSTNLFWWFPDDIYSYCKCYVSKAYGSSRKWRRFDTVHAPVGVANHNYNYPAGTRVQFRARAIYGSGLQGPYVYTPVVELPVRTLISTDAGNHRLKMIIANTMAYSADRFSSDYGNPRLSNPRSLAFSDDYIFLLNSDPEIVHRFTVSDFKLLDSYDGSGQPSEYQLTDCRGIAYFSGYLVVISKGNTLLSLSSSSLTPNGSYVSPEGSDPVFAYFRSICPFEANYFLVTNSDAISGFSKFGCVALPFPPYPVIIFYHDSYGSTGTGDGEFNVPQGIHRSGDYIYICDSMNNRIQVWTADPIAFDHNISSINGDPKSLNCPYYITSDDTYFYLSDLNNYRIVKFTKDGYNFVAEFGSYGNGHLDLNGSTGLALWPE